MNFIQFSIENPVKVTVSVMLIILFGFISLLTIPIQLTPNVDTPIITVTTMWSGRSPEEVEREVIEEQEDVLKDLSGLKKMTATAFEGQSQIELEFVIGTNIKNARQEVSDSLREVPDYPDEVDEPVIAESEAAAGSPIAWLILTSDTPGFDVQSIGEPVEDRVKPYLERIDGITEVRVYGGRKREVHIQIDPKALAQRGITFNQLRQALVLENVNTSGGNLEEGQYDVSIRTVGQYDHLDQVRDTIVSYDPAGGPVRVRDLGTVTLTIEKQRSFVRSRGTTALALPVYRATGSNVIAVMQELRQRMVEINQELLPIIARQAQQVQGLEAPPKLKVEQAYDETIYIDDALALVQDNLWQGGLLAVLILLMFLRSIRPTLIIALSIPISVIGTFVVMTAFGRNLNVISLAGLAFAVGMVVDNAIVVLENTDRHLAMGKKPWRAALDATQEVWGAVLASTLTTLAVFIPILTIQEEVGQLFRDIALAICASVSLSILVAVTVIPAASARWLRTHREPKWALLKVGRSLFGLAAVSSALNDRYADLVHRLIRKDTPTLILRLLIVAAFTGVSILGSWAMMPPTDYLPRGNKNMVFGFVLTPPGLNIDTNLELAVNRVEPVLRPYWEAAENNKTLADAYAEVGKLPPLVNPFTQQAIVNPPPIEHYFFVTFFGGVFNGAISADKGNVTPVAEMITAATNGKRGDTLGFAQQASLFQSGRGVGRGIDLEVLGNDLNNVLAAASALRGALMQKYGPMNVQPTPANFDKAGREMQVTIDRVQASRLGINVSDLGDGVRALVDGLYVGDYRLVGESIDILAVRDPSIPLTPEKLAQQPLAYANPDGALGTVPLSSVASLQRTQSPQQIQRIDEQRSVTLEVAPPEDVPMELATTQIEALIDQMRQAHAISPDVMIRLAGSASKLQEVREAMLGSWHGWTLKSLESIGLSRMFLALLVTYLLMAALFESFYHPFVIMFSVPLAAIGGFMGLAITHYFIPTQQLDTLTMLGFVILIGIVVNNAILLVHQSLNFMRGLGDTVETQGVKLAPRDAIRESVRTRTRPIFMTTLTSVFGMLPLVVWPGSGSELYRGLGSVVLGGLMVSTIFTLLLVPLMFSVALDLRLWIAQRFGLEAHELDAAPEMGDK
jgi:HAE1 family hydrophobic/amphiphilic exporter-1